MAEIVRFPSKVWPDTNWVYAADHDRVVADLTRAHAEVKRENDFIRAHAGNSAKSCVYCGLGAEEQGRCASGFPGCARADDQALCREAGVAMERDELRRELVESAAHYAKVVGDRDDDMAEARQILVRYEARLLAYEQQGGRPQKCTGLCALESGGQQCCECGYAQQGGRRNTK